MISPLRRAIVAGQLLLLVASARPAASAQAVRVVSDVAVDANPQGSPVWEPYIAIDPRDPNHLLAAAIVAAPAGASINEQHCASFVSRDGGAHWARHDLPVIECYDPWIVFLRDGTALFSSLGKDVALAGDGDGMLVYRSVDGGTTWNRRPAGLSWGWDHPMIIADTSAAKRDGWVYLVSSRNQNRKESFLVAVARSLDGGKSFDEPRVIAPEGQTLKAEPPAILSDGTLIVSYVELADAGIFLPHRRAFAVRTSNGIDFSKPSLINEVCGPPPGYQLSSLSVDGSAGIFRDRLYFACTLPSRAGVAVSYSADHGMTWSRPKSATGDPRVAGSPRSLMATGVSSNGVFGAVWLEHRAGSPAGCSDVFLSASFDGGERFTYPTRVSQASSCPNGKLNHGSSFGDYFALAADSRGRFRVAWADARTGLFQLHTALIELDGSALAPR